MQHKAYISLGSNVGDRIENIHHAIQQIDTTVGKLIAVSPYYTTQAWGKTDEPDFINAVVIVETALNPFDLLNSLIAIEKQLGRIRTYKNAPRTIDLDILFYDSLVLETPILTIPHPHAHQRNFVLKPLEDVAAAYIHPIFQKRIEELLKHSPDTLEVTLFKNNKPNRLPNE